METLFRQRAESVDNPGGYDFYGVTYEGDDILTARGQDTRIWVSVDSVCKALGFGSKATLGYVVGLEDDPGMVGSLILVSTSLPDNPSKNNLTDLLFIDLQQVDEWVSEIQMEYMSYPAYAQSQWFLDKLESYAQHLSGEIARKYSVGVLCGEVLSGQKVTEYDRWVQALSMQYTQWLLSHMDNELTGLRLVEYLKYGCDMVDVDNPSKVAFSLVQLYGDYVCDGDYAYAWELARNRLWCWVDVCIDVCSADGAVAMCVEDDGDWMTILGDLALMCKDAGIPCDKIGTAILQSGAYLYREDESDSCDGCDDCEECDY